VRRLAAAFALSLAVGLCQPPPGIAAKLGRPKVVKLAPLDNKALESIKAKKAEPQAVGTHRPLDPRVLDKGKWTKLRSGVNIWRLGIESPNASALRLHFTGFDIAEGKLWLYSQSGGAKPEVAGPYTGKGPNQDSDFWSDVIFSSTVIVEYQPAGTSQKIPFRTPAVSHMIER
jgi:hypothetical protein